MSKNNPGEIQFLLAKASISPELKRLDKEIKSKMTRKDFYDLMFDLSEIMLENINQFVPKNTGRLREKGYTRTISNSKTNPWFKIKYGNKGGLRYVMYQYYGKVWGPNYPKFTGEQEKFNPEDLKMRPAHIRYKHIGWYSSVNKKETWRHFARRRKTVKFKYGKYKGRVVVINGYTTTPQKIQPGWVEYAEQHQNDFTGFRAPMVRLIETTFRDILKGT